MSFVAVEIVIHWRQSNRTTGIPLRESLSKYWSFLFARWQQQLQDKYSNCNLVSCLTLLSAVAADLCKIFWQQTHFEYAEVLSALLAELTHVLTPVNWLILAFLEINTNLGCEVWRMNLLWNVRELLLPEGFSTPNKGCANIVWIEGWIVFLAI